MSEYVLGVDGGGTSTRAAALDLEGRLLGFGRSGPSNYDDVGVEVAQANIGAAVTAACTAHGLERTGCRGAFLGMAGVVSAEDHAAIHGIAARLALAPRQQTGVDHDCRIALAGGLNGRPGIVQILGTGSSCYGRNAVGESWMTGGRGPLISDEGSGYWLGIQAMRAAVMAHDGRLAQETVLLPLVCSYLGIGSTDEILHRLHVVGITRAEIAVMGPMVIEAAAGGDAAALDILQRGAEEVALCVSTTARRLQLELGPCEVCLVGGLIQAGPIVTDGLHRAIQRRLPSAAVREAALPPVLGAGLLALQAVIGTVTHPTIENLHRSKQAIQMQS